MAMSKTDFKNAFREVVSSEFSHIPNDESSINYTFSERFNKKMEKLLRLQKKVYYNFINTASKRAAIICLVIVTLFTTACGVKTIREPIVNFFMEVYESFTKYFFDGETAETITKEFSIKALPEGFEQTDVAKSDIHITTTYENRSGTIIEFSQTITEDTEHILDAEHGNTEKIMVSDREVHIIVTDEVTQAVWIQDVYLLRITCFGDVDLETIKTMIDSIE